MTKQELKQQAREMLQKKLGLTTTLSKIVLLETSYGKYFADYILFEIAGKSEVCYRISKGYKFEIITVDKDFNFKETMEV